MLLQLTAFSELHRHGARLDQANKQWHLTSPTPYDPPLTYAGWTQARNLGTRIAGIVKEREQGEAENPRKRKREHKVIIHSSPFLRCIQTSIGISAGIGQSETKKTVRQLRKSLPADPDRVQSHEPGETMDTERYTGHIPTKLRVDACLGEWLSPDYFEGITPPPNSVLMVAGAKADLLRAGDEVRGSDLSGNAQWTNPWPAREEPERTGLRAMAAGASPRNRAAFANNAKINLASRGMATLQEDQPAYISPNPMYAISSSDPIPGGYVAHARDACVMVDYQWDSMRAPQNWGDGGELGEEWSSMHRRFRGGIQNMLQWYEKSVDDDIDIVVVIVSHGAGCNALIGAITGQPVLLDIGLASLTMAVRKDASSIPSSPVKTRRGSLDLGISARYDMEIIASTEHLRAPSNTMGLNSPRLARSPAFASRRAVGADSLEGFTLGDPMNTRSSSYMGLGRSASQKSYYGSATRISSGLWNSSQSEDTESTDSDLWPAFDRGKALEEDEEEDQFSGHLPQSDNTQDGLWGSVPQEIGPKRRWTLVDQ